MTADQQPTLNVVEALELAKTDAAQLAGRLRMIGPDTITTSGRIIHGPSLWPSVSKPRRIGWLRYRWECTDDTTGEVLAAGHRPTETWAWHRAEQVRKHIYTGRLQAERDAEAGA